MRGWPDTPQQERVAGLTSTREGGRVHLNKRVCSDAHQQERVARCTSVREGDQMHPNMRGLIHLNKRGGWIHLNNRG